MAADPSRRVVVQLAACMAFNQTSLSLTMTVAALSGYLLAGDRPSLATLPLACLFLAMLATTIPASLAMARWGRKAGFALGAVAGVLSGLVSALAVYRGELWLLCVGLALYGVAAAHANYYRFAAADLAGPLFRSRAISYVLGGGVVAAVAGPFIATETRELFPPFLFAGCFLAIAVLSLLIFPVLLAIRFPPPAAATPVSRAAEGPARPLPARPLSVIVRQPAFLVAVASAMVGYGAMNLIMVSTPLAMDFCGFAFRDSATVIQWHVLGMYLPSFFTGHLIRRFGVRPMLALGLLLAMAAAAVNLHGQSYAHFWAALILLGMGWNFLFVGGTTLLTETYRPAERAKVQAANEFLVFGTTALTALSSGAVFSSGGWEALNLGVLPVLLLVLLAVAWSGRHRSQPA